MINSVCDFVVSGCAQGPPVRLRLKVTWEYLLRLVVQQGNDQTIKPAVKQKHPDFNPAPMLLLQIFCKPRACDTE